MFTLTVLHNTDLTDYVIQILQKNGIETIRDFIAADEDCLCKATNLTKHSFSRIKQELLKKYGPQQVRMSRLYLEKVKGQTFNYTIGITSLDSMLENNAFGEGCLLEVCGFSGVGKKQLCVTLAVNFAAQHGEVLFIDTQTGCIGTRIYQILKMRNVNKMEMGQIMQKIKVERTLSAQGVIGILKNLLDKLKSDCLTEISNIKLVIINSLPAVWLHILHGEKKLEGKYLLTCLANLMRKLSTQHSIVFFFVNLLVTVELEQRERIDTQIEEMDSEDEESDTADKASQHSYSSINEVIRPALGRYWLSVPTMRLSIEKINAASYFPDKESSSMRIVRVLKSCYTRTGDTCFIRITKAGVV